MAPKTPLLRPGAYFAERPNAVDVGIGVFLVYAAVTFVGILVVFLQLLGRAENVPAARNEFIGIGVGAAIAGTVMVLLVGLLIAAILHLFAGGTGSYLDALGVAGWAHAPNLVLQVPIGFLLSRREFAGRTFDFDDPARLAASSESIEASIALPELIVGLIVIAWSVLILTAGIATTHEVSRERAAYPAAIIGLGALFLLLV